MSSNPQASWAALEVRKDQFVTHNTKRIEEEYQACLRMELAHVRLPSLLARCLGLSTCFKSARTSENGHKRRLGSMA
eukprot:5917216-Amphidinium_carterae.1